jgi:CheY-like chemotaxis protein
MTTPELGIFLLVDDEKDDIALVQQAFIKAKVLNPLFSLNSGEEAIAYLSGEGIYKNRQEFPLPTVVLLDLRMRGIDGFDVLRWIRRQPTLASLRVVVLTGSRDIRDVDLAYKAGANSFLIKPTDFQRFIEISQALAGYWMWLGKEPSLSLAPSPLPLPLHILPMPGSTPPAGLEPLPRTPL